MLKCLVCGELYNFKSGFDRFKCDCRIETHSRSNIYVKARYAYYKKLSEYVRKCYDDIMKAVEKGRINITLLFESEDHEIRSKLVLEVMHRLQKKFKNVSFTHSIDFLSVTVDWSMPVIDKEDEKNDLLLLVQKKKCKNEDRTRIKRQLFGSDASDTEASDTEASDTEASDTEADDTEADDEAANEAAVKSPFPHVTLNDLKTFAAPLIEEKYDSPFDTSPITGFYKTRKYTGIGSKLHKDTIRITLANEDSKN